MNEEHDFQRSGISQEELELLDYLLADEGVERHQSVMIMAQSQETPCRLSFAQEQMWLFNQLEPESAVYNIPFALRLAGLLDRDALGKSFKEIIKRHAILRSAFPVIDGSVQQVVQPSSEASMFQIDLKALPETLRETEARKVMQSEAEYTFDLVQGPLWRATLVQLDMEHAILVLVFHHIVADGWSLEVFMRELGTLYSAILQGEASLLPPLAIQYTDYAAWQRSSWDGDNYNEERDYWIQQLIDAPLVLELPTTYSRPVVQTFHGATYSFDIPSGILRSLRSVSEQESVTMFMVMLGAFQTLLFRYTDQADILVGCPIANRDLRDIKSLIGVFINTLVLRTDLSGNPSFQKLLHRIKDMATDAYQHQHVPFEYLVKQFEQTRDISRNPLVQIMFAYQNTSQQTLSLSGLDVQPLALHTNTSKADLILYIEESTNSLHGSIEYNTDLYDQRFIASFVESFQTLLQSVIDNPKQSLLALPIVGASTSFEKRISFTFPEQSTITQLFEEAVAKFPNHVALKYGETRLTYAELNSRANRLACVLRDMGAQPDDLIGIYIERSIEMIIGILAILKAGAAYLPLDPHYPIARLSYILEDSHVQIVCAQSHLASDLPFCDNLVMLDTIALEGRADTNLPPSHNARSLAYVIYTSGTTGRPKGVMVEHRQIVQLLRNDKFSFDFDENSIWTMFHSFCFDFSVWEMYGALLNGGQLTIIPRSMTLDMPAYRDLLKKEHVTVLNQTPGAFFQLCEEEKKHHIHDLSLRYVIFGGEALKPGRLKEWQQFYPSTQLINMYGITETTVHVTYKEVTSADIHANISNIGAPLPPMSIYILNSTLQLAPLGVVGEIFVGGEGVARGYLHNPDLTLQKFIVNPFDQRTRLYRTGDLGKWINSEEIEYVGRSDQQVKIHGFRIEIGEIEAHIRSFQDITDVIVLPIEDTQGDLALCGYVVTSQTGDPREFIAMLKAYLKQHLPVHMLPAFIVPVDDLPLTEHGKIDKAALPDPKQYTDPGELYVPPRDQLERSLVKIWAEVLKLPEEKVSIQSRFFDMGGEFFQCTCAS